MFVNTKKRQIRKKTNENEVTESISNSAADEDVNSKPSVKRKSNTNTNKNKLTFSSKSSTPVRISYFNDDNGTEDIQQFMSIANTDDSSLSKFKEEPKVDYSNTSVYTNEYLKSLKEQQPSKRPIINNRDVDVDMTDRDYSLKGDVDMDDVSIPNENQIKLAKEKRQRQREGKWQHNDTMNEDDGFVPLSSKEISNQSRLVRESNDDEDDEQDFNYNQSNIIKTTIAPSNIDTSTIEEKEDDEIRNWIQNQMKKGGSGGDSERSRYTQPEIDKKRSVEKELLNQYTVSSIETSYIEDLFKEFEQVRISWSDSVNSQKLELSQKENLYSDIQLSLLELESVDLKLKDQYIYYDEIKSYFDDLNDCLIDKLPLIENIETKILELDSQHAALLKKQKSDEISDCYFEIESREQINKNGDGMSALVENDEDEFGRSRNHYQESLKKSRMKLAVNYKQSVGFGDFDLMNSDAEVLYDQNSEKDYQVNRKDLIGQLQMLFDNVDQNYHEIGLIRDRFLHWKSKDLESYKKAQIPLILPKVFSTFINIQLLNWNPLIDKGFDHLGWYQDLLNYTSDNEQDCDFNLIPTLIRKLVLPKIEYHIKNHYNPLSRRHNKSLQELFEELKIYYNDQEKEQILQPLYQVTLHVMKSDDTILLPLLFNPESQEFFSFVDKIMNRTIKYLEILFSWCGTSTIDHWKILEMVSNQIIGNKITPFLIVLLTCNLEKTLGYYKLFIDTIYNQLLNHNLSKLHNMLSSFDKFVEFKNFISYRVNKVLENASTVPNLTMLNDKVDSIQKTLNALTKK
ncbi:GC-rich sequence DNA-binding factor-like protein [Tieghemostelium lacteum]|uniref:GC-rich sequence DNA-binding factor-like protein n=1 Tax=Tieghemostelium lacteum TaxID=361077 RepID=A0A152A583_TIELA|nr:GC-rich sequence DNA-binding factor-like protein [Tieghemostelium lacteum]|eukprot:KYR01402.1 GC-rich sequence DNA-binding factor-like protein [Tieghemostelium lacteum]